MNAIQNTTPLSCVVTKFEERNNLKFKPERSFYERIGINKVRFWQLVRGEKEPFSSELVSLATYFNVPLSELV
ncbi:hypothetical protein GCM10028805_46150 [Spirosoma harenae]